MSDGPPSIAGLDVVSTIGSGGYADVYAYDQRLPARRVAVKVLRDAAASGPGAAAFLSEANALARLEHPHIVPVYSAGTSADGRPYLVMQHCPGPNLAARSRARPLGVAEVVRIGVQIGGALETAHRNGVLHRDVKPSNILTDQYGTPQLADFGLAGAMLDADESELGVSVPWAAPETLFGTAPASVRSDVYSLAATLWTLLAGHAPFETQDGENGPVAMLRRIRVQPVGPVPRAGVPDALAAALAGALAKDPAERPASVLALVRELQQVQRLLGLPPTEPVVGEPSPVAPVDTVVSSDAVGAVRRVVATEVTLASGLLHGVAPHGLERTVVRAQPPVEPPERSAPRRAEGVRPVLALAVAVAAVLVALLVLGWWLR